MKSKHRNQQLINAVYLERVEGHGADLRSNLWDRPLQTFLIMEKQTHISLSFKIFMAKVKHSKRRCPILFFTFSVSVSTNFLCCPLVFSFFFFSAANLKIIGAQMACSKSKINIT